MLRNALIFLYFLEVIGFFAIGTLTLLRQHSKLHKTFFLFATLLGVWQLLQLTAVVVADRPQIATILLMTSVMFSTSMTVALYIFSRTFAHRRVSYWLFLLVIIIAPLAFISDGLRDVPITLDGIGIPRLDAYYAGIIAFDLFFLLASLFNFVRFYRQTKDQKERTQTGVILWSIALAGVVIIFSSFYTGDFSSTLLAQQVIPFTCLVVLLIFMYAMTYKDLFDIHVFALRAGAYVSTYFMIALLVIAPIVYIISSVFNLGLSLVSVFGYSLVLVIFTYIVQFLRLFLDRITSGIFFRNLYDTQTFLDEHNNVLVANSELQSLLNDSSGIIKKYIQAHTCIFWLRPTTSMPERFIGSEKAPKISMQIMNELMASRALVEDQILIVDESDTRYKHLKDILSKQGISVAIRLSTLQGGELGLMMLGPKKSGGLYNKRDTKVLRIIAKELVIAIQNALRFEEIQEFNQTLQEKIADATKELRKTNEQLKKLDTAKDEFVSMASHQLRTPLTSVKGYISMVLEGDVGKITPMQRQLLGEAFTSSERMVHLIGDFLNVSRLQTGKFLLEKRPIDLSKLVSQEIDSLQTTAEAHGLKLEYRKPSHFPILMLDEGKIRQVLMNFIDNAIFYSQEGETITVKLELEAGYAVLRVIDEGIGVPKSEQAHLFAKFYRASNARKQRPDGTGVGLFLAKKVVVAHGGTIVFESKEGEGSTFGFRLPVKKLQAPEEEMSASASNRANKLNK